MLARSPMATIYRHLATYFSFPIAILGDCTCVRLARMCGTQYAWHNTWAYATKWRAWEQVRDDFAWISSGLSLCQRSIRDGDTTQADASSSRNPTAPPSKRRCFNSEWAEGHEWLKHDNENGVMFCEWCRCFNRNEHRNQFEGMCINETWEHTDLEPGLSQIQTVQLQRVT